MWQHLDHERDNKVSEIEKLKKELDDINKDIRKLTLIINDEVNKELNVYLKRIFFLKTKTHVRVDTNGFDYYMNIYLQEDSEDGQEQNNIYSVCIPTMLSIINKLIKGEKVKKIFGRIKTADHRSNFCFDIEDKIFYSDLEECMLFRPVLSKITDILLFYHHRTELHKKFDVISTKKSVCYLLKHFKSPGSTLSSFPKDIIIYICKKALTF